MIATETRRIIGVFDDLLTKKDVSFPSVRIWINGPNKYQTQGLKESFPDRGTVFLHISASEGQHPQKNQVGLFDCVPSPGEKAEWKVSITSKRLARVVDYPSWELDPRQLAFWEWMTSYKNGLSYSIFLGDGITFVKRGKRELIGPFVISPEGKLAVRDQTFVFQDIDVPVVEIARQRCGVIDAELLPKGQPIILDPRIALSRRLKLVSQTGQVDWLTRAKMQELSNALASVSVDDGSQWVVAEIPRALDIVCSSGSLDPKLIEAILQSKAVEQAIEAAWKVKHAAEVGKADESIRKLNGTANDLKSTIDKLNAERGRIEQDRTAQESVLLGITKKIEEAKSEAQKVFDAELKRLAQSPASMALLGAWSAGGSQSDRARPLIRVERLGGRREQTDDLSTALLNNLKKSGLFPKNATEVSAVCCAALAAGQPISLRSLFSDTIAQAVTAALGQPFTIWAEVPAGLLDPVDWNTLLPKEVHGSPVILQAANRSDIPLVLGSLRSTIVRQSIGDQKPSSVVLLTLESNKGMQVESHFYLGPLIDDRVLNFSGPKPTADLFSFPEFAKDLTEVVPASDDEFAEIGDDLLRLSILQMPSERITYRRAYSALKEFCEESKEVPKLFFKYWCLPRITPADAGNILQSRKDVWAQDKSLMDLAQSLVENE